MSRPITVVVGGLASASATKIGLSQKAAISGTNYLVLNGAAGSFSANSICASQTPGGAVALTLNGSLASSVPSGTAVAYLGSMRRIYITGGSDESGKTFTVIGTGTNANGGLFAVKEVITGPNASTVSSINQYFTITSITASAGTSGAITVGHYDTATLDVARQVIITSGGNDTGVTFTLSGTDSNGQPQSEPIVGASGGAKASVLSYKTITSLSSSGAVATTVTVGTNGVADSQWVRFDQLGAMAQVAIQATVSGTVNYTISQTIEDPNVMTGNVNAGPPVTNQWTPYGVTWVNHPDSAVVAATATAQANYAYTPVFAKVTLNSGTGTVTATFAQAYRA